MPPDSPFIHALGTSAAHKASRQTDTPAQRALEKWERTLCENKAVAILAEVQAGRPALIQKDGGEMLIAIVLDRPLAEWLCFSRRILVISRVKAAGSQLVLCFH